MLSRLPFIQTLGALSPKFPRQPLLPPKSRITVTFVVLHSLSGLFLLHTGWRLCVCAESMLAHPVIFSLPRAL